MYVLKKKNESKPIVIIMVERAFNYGLKNILPNFTPVFSIAFHLFMMDKIFQLFLKETIHCSRPKLPESSLYFI